MRSTRRGATGRRLGIDAFSVIEMIITLSLGVLVLGAAVGLLLKEMRTLAGRDLREGIARNGRYVGVSLRHDLHRAGVDIESTVDLGTVDVWSGAYGDTLLILHVPFVPEPAPPHPLVPPPGTNNPLSGSTCGAYCVEVTYDTLKPLELAVGDLARLQIVNTRRLILVQDIRQVSDTSITVQYTQATSIMRQPAGLSGGVLLDRFGTYVQKLVPTVYYVDAQERLMRADGLNLNGSPRGEVLAYNVEQFDARLVFADGDVAEQANPVDGDDTNDFDDIVAVTVAVTLRADRVDPRVNAGAPLRRSYEWTISPRNLRYEKERL